MFDDPKLWEHFEHACAEMGVSTEIALKEKARELRYRHFLRCVPDERLKDHQLETFVAEVLGRRPPKTLIDAVRRKDRERTLTDAELLDLERRQSMRCRLCGVLLLGEVRAHVDHILPVALGGTSDLLNLQLLCSQCNLGKGAVLDWIVGAAYATSGAVVSCRLRYCVLSRDEGRCAVLDCQRRSNNSEMTVATVVPLSRGGRCIFDNLRTYCVECQHGRLEEERFRLLANLRLARLR